MELIALGHSATDDGQIHRPVASKHRADLPYAELLSRLAVDLLDEVAALDADLLSRRTVDGGDHVGIAEALGDDQTEAGIIAFDIRLITGHLGWRHVVAEFVNRIGDAVESAVDQLIGRYIFDVVATDQTEDLSEDAEIAIEPVLLGGLAEDRAAQKREHESH